MTDKWDALAFKTLPRDFQRRKVYRAEAAFRKELAEEALKDPELRQFLLLVKEHQWFIERFGDVTFKIQVSGRRKNSACCSFRGSVPTLKFPSGSDWVTRAIALHELAHVITRGQHHGPVFCSVFLHLVIQYLGWTAGATLRQMYRINRVQLCV